MMAILVAIVMLIFIVMFLFSSVIRDQGGAAMKAEYRNLYANNMLLSLLRMDVSCGLMSDALKSAYFGSGSCSGFGFESAFTEFADELVLSTGNPDYEWLLEASPKNFDGSVVTWGNQNVKGNQESWDARTILTWEGKQLEIKLYIVSS